MAIKQPGIIYLQPMQCGTCGTIIQIEEQETTTVIVNAQGLPVNSDCTGYEVKGVCPRCGRVYNVVKDGMYFELENETFNACPLLKTKELLDVTFGVEI